MGREDGRRGRSRLLEYNCVGISEIIGYVYPRVLRNTYKMEKGTNNVHSKVLQECATTLSYPLTILLRKSIALGSVTDSWREAIVTSIYRKGNTKL